MLNELLQQQSQLSQDHAAWLLQLRKKGRQAIEAQGLPNAKQEAWKYTSIKSLQNIGFTLGASFPEITSNRLPCARFEAQRGIKATLVNGRFNENLSHLHALPKGLEIMSLAQACKTKPDLVQKYLDQQAPTQREAFAAINTAFLEDGIFIKVEKGVVVEAPIEIFYISLPEGAPSLSHPRVLVLAEAGAQFHLIESFAGRRLEYPYLTNSVTEIFVEPGAIVQHYKLQAECEDSFHLASLAVRQRNSSVFRSCQVALGGQLSRQDVYSLLGEPGAECELNGLYLANRRQHMDSQTLIDHAVPHCTSHELYKGILDDQAHGVFNGQIKVRPQAQKTQSSLTNNNLLLSRDACVDTKPLLKIYADDVKCSHGATIGRLDENQVFYLRSRGIAEKLARNLLTYAFASEIVQQFKMKSLRNHLEEILLNRLRIGELSVAA